MRHAARVRDDEGGYQPDDSRSPGEWMRLEPRRMWHVFALGLLGAAAYAIPAWLNDRPLARIVVPAVFFGLFMTALGAYRLRKRQRH